MQIKLDENISSRLAPAIRALGHDVDTVADEGLVGRPDSDVWSAAQTGGRLLVTTDLDFSDARHFAPGTHRGIVLVRLRVPSRRAIEERLLAVFNAGLQESWRGQLVVVTDTRVRLARTGKRP
jgi:predicted nuclease of predicted toxin-antitoxin system